MTTDLFPGRKVPFLSLFIALGLVLAGALPAVAVTPEEDPDAAAAGWLVESYDDHPDSFGFGGGAGDIAELIFALSAAGVAGERAGGLLADLEAAAPDYLPTGNAAIAKTLLAVLVAGGDPTDFAGTDLEADLRDGKDDTGAFDATAFNQSLAILALAATGNGIPADAVSSLQGLACDDGGYGFDCSGGSDVDSTAMAVQALLAADADASAAVQWLADAQEDNGSFLAFGSPSPNSTGLAAMALRAAGRTAAADAAADWMATQQAGCDEENAGSIASPFDGQASLEFATLQGLLAFAAPRYDQLDLTAAAAGVPVVCAQEVADPTTDTAGDDTLATDDDRMLADGGVPGVGLALLAALLVAGGLTLVRIREDT
ncbi:MAG: hypothetical protein R3343_05910 [Nitriliruptorales bacterium]|nr:hypothetical protein [Nitriliruptorales bacterium]